MALYYFDRIRSLPLQVAAALTFALLADFKVMLGLGDRLATAQVSALLKRGLLESDSSHGKLRLGVSQHALRFYFPNLWPEADCGLMHYENFCEKLVIHGLVF